MKHPSIALVGLGRMGAAMARRLGGQGFDVRGYDTAPEARARLRSTIAVQETLEELAQEPRIWLLSLPSSVEVEQVLTGDGGVLARLPAGSRIVDTSSSDPDSTRRLAGEARKRGIPFVDAPVSGGPAGAEAGTLTFALGGSQPDIEALHPVLTALGSRLVHVGDSGAGHVAKLVNNMLCAAHLLVDGAGLRLARQAGVDPVRVVEAINAGSGRSGVTETFMPKWILSETFDSGFTMGLMRKDLRLAAGLAQRLGGSDVLERIAAFWEAETERLGANADFTRAAATMPEDDGDPTGGGTP